MQELNRFELRLSGLGGQGIITLGKILGTALALGHGYYVTQTQSYGPEARGGSSRADLVISSHPISYPKTENLDLLVALSQEACNAYYRYLKPNGVLMVDTSMVANTPTNVYKGLPFTTLAKDKIGLVQTLNILVLGAVTHLLPFAGQRRMKKAVEQALPPKIQEINIKAFNLGHREAAKHFGDAPAVWLEAEEMADAEEDTEHV
ncbi:MAG: 2-oxoacid:acceptor oxidoreductase family protein [Desulfovibrionaceae bacterium]|nr:2-oxoacid:acceptor oxidoreductase family protein [Desulfovibrionaceae bacterium]